MQESLRLSSLTGVDAVGDPDLLPYFITDVAVALAVPVAFAPLTDADRGELQSEAWSDARFKDVWLEWCGEEQTRKLILAEDERAQIHGIVRPGVVRRGEFAGRALRDSLLETAPFNRQEAESRAAGEYNCLAVPMYSDCRCVAQRNVRAQGKGLCI